MNKDKSWTDNNTTELFKGILTLKTIEEAEDFFRDLMTLQEIDTISARFKAANLLMAGELSYRQIASETGMSTTTITRINEWLDRGNNGYKSVLDSLHHHKADNPVVL